ncbi:MAG: hypothetical protein OEW09_00915, partial [Anaerolineae bacterium]|nr:hypothetical protein [Anaerolineae bacterium]
MYTDLPWLETFALSGWCFSTVLIAATSVLSFLIVIYPFFQKDATPQSDEPGLWPILLCQSP